MREWNKMEKPLPGMKGAGQVVCAVTRFTRKAQEEGTTMHLSMVSPTQI